MTDCSLFRSHAAWCGAIVKLIRLHLPHLMMRRLSGLWNPRLLLRGDGGEGLPRRVLPVLWSPVSNCLSGTGQSEGFRGSYHYDARSLLHLSSLVKFSPFMAGGAYMSDSPQISRGFILSLITAIPMPTTQDAEGCVFIKICLIVLHRKRRSLVFGHIFIENMIRSLRSPSFFVRGPS